ncbi:MAG: hypothetical protein WC343_07740 [Bacilli bacterium]
MSNPTRLFSGDGIKITQHGNALDVNIASGSSALPTGAATSAKQDTGNTSLSSIDGKLPALVGGKIPVDASVSIDSIDIGDVDIKEFPAGNLGQQLKAASLSVAPATDIVDATYIGDVKFGEELPAGTQLVGKVGIDQTTPGTTNLVNVNGGASQTTDIKVTLDSESVAVTGPLTDAQLTTQALAKEATLGSVNTAVEALAVATPDTASGDLASMSSDLGSIDSKLAASIINEYAVTLTAVDTEYSQALPANTKGIEFVSRGGYPVRYAFTTGKVAMPTGVYFTLKSNCAYESPATLNLSSKTIYFASDNAGDVVELIAWS